VRIGNRSYSNVLIASGAETNAEAFGTPKQSEWKITGFEGARKIPGECHKKDDAHFLCSFDAESVPRVDDCGNLIASGYGFCQSVTLEKQIELKEAADQITLLLSGIDGAAAEVWIDENAVGFAYGPDWSLPCRVLNAGCHVIRVRLINSGYNVHGPHHYYLGDFKLTSPLHIRGVKHFGDLPDAPQNTHISQWHFVNYRLFGSVHLLDKPIREA